MAVPVISESEPVVLWSKRLQTAPKRKLLGIKKIDLNSEVGNNGVLGLVLTRNKLRF